MRRLRAIIERDYTASLLNATKWMEVFAALHRLPLWWRLKLITTEQPCNWGKGVQASSTAAHLPFGWVEGCGYSPFMALEIEWLEVQPAVEPDERAQGVDERTCELVENQLSAIGVGYERAGVVVRVTGHVRNVGPVP